MRVERSFRGITVRLAVRYLENLGGEVVEREGGLATPDGSAVIADDDWEATLTATRVSVGPSLTLTEVRVVFEGEDIDGLVERFARKAVRAGG